VIIIIDAYNFFKSISAHKNVGDAMIQSWISRFSEYMKIRKNKIILVFDAGPFTYQSRDVQAGVGIIYAGQGYSADDAIKNWMEQHATQDILLVTSDRQIRQHGANLGVISISSQEFFKIFNQVGQHHEHQEQVLSDSIVKIKRHERDDAELDRLMELASRDLIVSKRENEYDGRMGRLPGTAKVGKQDRKILKKIEKI
jgi:predicted RNA-binding protein with PIN domain